MRQPDRAIPPAVRIVRLLARVRVAFAALALAALAAAPSTAAESRPPLPVGKPVEAAPAARPAATVTIEFEGGLVGQEMAKVIAAFGPESDLLPARFHLPAETVGLCGVLASELSVPSVFCTRDLLEAVAGYSRRKGREIDPDRVTSTGGIYLPDVRTAESAIVRLYNQSRPDEAKQIEQRTRSLGWSPSILGVESDVLAKSGVAEGAPQIDALTLKRYTWTFDVADEDASLAASYLGLELNGPNLFISVEPTTPGEEPRRYNAYPADIHFKHWCGGGAGPAPRPEGLYADMLGSLYATDHVAGCTGSGAVRPEVAIMDQQIKVHPDLLASFSDDPAESAPAPAAACTPRPFQIDTDHGTLLASIVAARPNDYGFAGLAPEARIRSFVFQPGTSNREIKSFIEATDQVSEIRIPRVFLIASEFKPLIPFPKVDLSPRELRAAKLYWRWNAGARAFDTALADDDARLLDPLVREVLTRTFLLVAAAGQQVDDEEGEPVEGLEIDWERPLAPQNLGDDDNVLVVGACANCASPEARLWPNSNRGKPGNIFVSVLAPGGVSVPTYVSETEIASTVGGTSSAAAFVAGLAARMAACHPATYLDQPENLKARIILASRPTHDAEIVRTVVGGVVDPAVSMLDPRKDWLKLAETDVRPVAFDGWCTGGVSAEAGDSGGGGFIELPGTQRLTAVDGALVRQSVSDPVGGSTSFLSRRIVHREPPRWPKTPDARLAAVTEASGAQCAVAANRLEDLFLSQDSAGRQEIAACDALELCE
ncbi:S8 family serine peptidase [Mongoliimonas terrestris]|uniref:S8 family serine peptidase n=1 Tax=Mongoliimonas terrestris TaxID=1709001 RepID=UPI0009495700|nr:S8 family serine peptidase [Mongoliimonas terrestris]